MDRLLNFVLAVCLLVFTGPLLLLIAVGIKWESPGPVFEGHPATNREGRLYEALTFRVAEYDPARGRWARKLTRVGWFLQYTQMEALPQLINVVRGDMNLIEVGRYSSSSWL